jgi:hypothetical protein
MDKRQIVAADSSRTEIPGKFEWDYMKNPVSLTGFPWYAQLFMKSHVEIESDPIVWNRIESLIRSKLPPL